MKFIGFYSYTVILTYLSLVSGLVGMKLAFDGHPHLAVCCLLLSGICDMFDGVVARTKKNRTPDEKNFGIQIDSLCDAVCFGVFPAVFLYFSGMDKVYSVAILVLLVLCGVIRLAFFNVLETKRQMTEEGCAKGYRGLPITSSAIIFPLLHLLGLVLQPPVKEIVYHVVTAVTAILFIWDFQIPKLDIGKLFRKKA